MYTVFIFVSREEKGFYRIVSLGYQNFDCRSCCRLSHRMQGVGYNHFISNKGKWNNCFSKFSNRVLPPIFISTILQSGKFLNLAHYFPYDVKLRLLAHSRSFLANKKAGNAIVGAENLLKADKPLGMLVELWKNFSCSTNIPRGFSAYKP